ncbi:MAG: hypothetical protein IRZ15_09220 [Bryobacteraceae bacterium]|nr:hypothetical protein [Bryobacteraceae bacterium]
MITNTNSTSRPSLFHLLSSGLGVDRNTRIRNSFKDHLEPAGFSGYRDFGRDATSSRISNGPTAEEQRQSFVTAPKIEPKESSDQALAATNPLDPKEVLSEALRQAGIDPESIGLTTWSETVTYPGGPILPAGYYINNFITADLGPKGKFDFNADLMLRNPRVTVNEIREILQS